jgi:hypothetical protein
MATTDDSTASDQPPAVLDVDVQGERVLATVERGEIAVVVEAPVEHSAEQVEALLEDVPSKIEPVTEMFAGTERTP